MSQRVMRWVGVLAILQGLALAVLPLRGLAAASVRAGDWMPVVLYVVGMVGFVAAGLSLIGVLPLRRVVSPLLVLASALSLVAMTLLGVQGGVVGAVLSAVLLLVGLWRGAVGWPTPTDHHGRLWHVVGGVAGVLFLAYVGVAGAAWPWHRAWGSTLDELTMPLPGDRPNRDPAFEVQHAVTIDAPPAAVWSWLVQLGQDRAGFYSYDWLERAFGAHIDNVLEIRPEWQTRRAGDFVRATQPGFLGGLFGSDLGWRLDEVQPPRVMVLHHWGAFVLLPTADGGTRFIIRSTISNARIPVWAAVINLGLFELPHFVMERRMMLTIKALAEGHPARSTVARR